MCRLGSENTRPTGGRQEHAPNPSRPQATVAGKGFRLYGIYEYGILDLGYVPMKCSRSTQADSQGCTVYPYPRFSVSGGLRRKEISAVSGETTIRIAHGHAATVTLRSVLFSADTATPHPPVLHEGTHGLYTPR